MAALLRRTAMAELQDVRGALAEAKEDLLSKPNVVAVGVGRKVVGGRQTDEIALIASVESKWPEARLSAAERVPSTVDGLPTDVVRRWSTRYETSTSSTEVPIQMCPGIRPVGRKRAGFRSKKRRALLGRFVRT